MSQVATEEIAAVIRGAAKARYSLGSSKITASSSPKTSPKTLSEVTSRQGGSFKAPVTV
jgi:hypothetical protein